MIKATESKVMESSMEQAVQGDVFLLRRDKAPDGMSFAPIGKELVVALGESHGHRHAIVADPESEVQFGKDSENNIWLNVLNGTATQWHVKEDGTKADHVGITFTPGIYQLPTQREYDEMGDRAVID